MIKTTLNSDRTLKNKYLLLFLSLTLVVGWAGTACEGPTGSEGSEGPEGPEGPVGPAGEDGSMMYAGEGEPDSETGDLGDFYLDQETGELYGPKDEDGWGDPGIVLMGEDGADGEDGSQIYSGEGAPDEDLGEEGDYYLDRDNHDLYGPKTSSGWGSPLNLKGADGNANVTRYIYPGHDFEADYQVTFLIGGLESEQEMRENAWLVYIKDRIDTYHHIPGEIRGNAGTMNRYRVAHEWASPYVRFIIGLTDGNGDEYNAIEVVRITSGNTEDHTKQHSGKVTIPDHVDTADYKAVAEYYGF